MGLTARMPAPKSPGAAHSGGPDAASAAAARPLSTAEKKHRERPGAWLAPRTPAAARLAVAIQVLVISGPLTAAFFATAPARVAAAHPQLAACAPATLPQLLPRLLAASALPLAFGIVLVGQGRFLNPLAMNPLSHPAADRVVSRYLQNTLEQYILHAAAIAGLAAWGRCGAAAAAVPWFCLGRGLFLAGYLLHPIYRGVGFSMTFLPSLFALGLCARETAVQGLTAGL